MEKMNMHSTDALPHKQTKYFETGKIINEKVLQRFEGDLDDFEKISILFLMTADDPEQYEKILHLCENITSRCNVITEFVKNELHLWREKLLEALCVVDNREILRNLGFSSNDVVSRYQQNISRYTIAIHPASKVLYKLFETMDEEKTRTLFRYIYDDDGIERRCIDNRYLELHAVYWLRAKYITISPGGQGDLSKLLKHLKKMGYYSELIYHDVEHFSPKTNENDFCSSRTSLPEALHEVREEHVSVEWKTTDVAESYVIKKGKCVIINEENFLKKYEKREGTEKDSENLRRTFLGLGFEVVEYKDLAAKSIFEELQRISKTFDPNIHDCLVVIILSHGYEGGIVSSDGNEIPIKVIENLICSWELRDIIKILIVQACQGEITGDVSQNAKLALDGPPGKFNQNTVNILRYAKFVKFMSTMRGFNSIRHKEDGSWFIQAVCEVLANTNGIRVSQWLMGVTKNVRSRVGYVNDCPLASQLPEHTSRLDVEVYFPPYEEKRDKTRVDQFN